jgi:hypothetical protein
LVQPSSGVIAAFVPTIFSFRQRAIIHVTRAHLKLLSLRNRRQKATRRRRPRVPSSNACYSGGRREWGSVLRYIIVVRYIRVGFGSLVTYGDNGGLVKNKS